LDEFYMVRIGGLERELQRGSRAFEPGPDGLSVAEVHERAHRSARALGARLGDLYMDVLRPALASEGVVLATRDALDGELAEVAERFYRREVHPVLTPLAIDRAHPFPMLRSGSVNLALLVEAHPNGKGTAVRTGRMSHPGTLFALVQVPAVLPRFIALSPGEGRDRMYVALEDIVARHVADVFPGHHIREAAAFRITRSSDLDFVEEEADDLLATIRDELRRRDLGEPVRLEIEAGASEELTRELMSRLELGDSHLHRCRGPVAGKDLMRVFGEVQRADLKDPTFNPLPAPRLRYAASIFRAIAERDILLHHPYESFRHVVDFIEQAAEDPDVVAIKQTLYRTSGDSPIVRALTQAAEQGKDVTALVELKARFDEANNIAWARRLEESGVHVVYGLIGLKTHSKMLLVTRREGDQLKRYLHLGTGNYHPSTARLY
ncbi:MAG: polyphosphate kinase 1, partial [Myxococcota bacterium]